MHASTPLLHLLATVQSVDVGPAASGLGGTEGPDMTRYLLVCIGLLGAIALLAWGFQRVIGKSLASKAARRSIQVMDVLPMGGRKRLAVVRCYDRTFLLGMGDKELSLVAELDGAIEPEREPTPGEADRGAFLDLLRRVPERPPRRPTPEPTPPNVANVADVADTGELVPAAGREPRSPAKAPKGGGWIG